MDKLYEVTGYNKIVYVFDGHIQIVGPKRVYKVHNVIHNWSSDGGDRICCGYTTKKQPDTILTIKWITLIL